MNQEDVQVFQSMIEMLGQAGDGAFWVGILWVMEGYFQAVMTVVALALISYLIFSGISKLTGLQRFADTVKREVGCRGIGCLPDEDDLEAVLRAIRKGRDGE